MNGKISNLQQIISVNEYTLKDSKIDVIDCNNGKIRFLLNKSRAMDIMQVYHKGTNISFISKNGFNNNVSFIQSFEGGMVYTCGLNSVGTRNGFRQHGDFHTYPAKLLSITNNEKEIIIKSVVSETSLFGYNLKLYRNISTKINSEEIIIEDVLVNEGFENANYCILYHVNSGYPILDNGATIIADYNNIYSNEQWAKDNINDALNITDDFVGQEEMCYYIDLKKPNISLRNNEIKKEFSLEYSNDTLPNFLMWKSMRSGDYALGFEPCSTKLDEDFEYKIIKPKEEIKFNLKLKIIDL